MATVFLICGKICSGKTWYARELKKNEQAVILSTDEVTFDLTDNAQGPDYMAFAQRVNGYLLKKTAELVSVGCNVILEWGFWTKRERQEIGEYFRCRNIPVQWHYIDVSDARWEINIQQRNQRILEGNGGWDFYVDEGLYQKAVALFEVPNPEEMDVWYKFEM